MKEIIETEAQELDTLKYLEHQTQQQIKEWALELGHRDGIVSLGRLKEMQAQEIEQAKRGEAYCLQEKERILSEFCLLQVKYGEQKHEIRNMAQEIERLKVELKLGLTLNHSLRDALASMTSERDARVKGLEAAHFTELKEKLRYTGEYRDTKRKVEQLVTDLATSQARVKELEDEKCPCCGKQLQEHENLKDIPSLVQQVAQLQATLAAREARIAELEQSAQRITLLGAAVSDEAGWETAKRFEALYDTARQDAARLRAALQLALARPWAGIESAVDRDRQQAERALKG